MLKMAVLYRQPEDSGSFEKRYVEGHLPLIREYDNIKEVSMHRVTRSLVGEFPYAYVFTGTWADKEGWKADMNSEKAAKATEDAKSFAPAFDVVVLEEIA